MIYIIELHIDKDFQYQTYMEGDSLYHVRSKLENYGLKNLEIDKETELRNGLLTVYEHPENGNTGSLLIEDLSERTKDPRQASEMIEGLIHKPA